MTTTHASPLAHLITPIIKPTFALFAALAVGGAWAGDDLVWGNADGAYSSPNSWTSAGDLTGYESIYEWKTGSIGKNLRFDGVAAGKTVTMDIWDNRVWNCWFYNGSTPVVFDSSSASNGFEAYWGFHLSTAANDTSSLTIRNGLYTTPSSASDNCSNWANGDNSKVTINLQGGAIELWGATGNNCLKLTSGTGVSSTLNISGGTLAVKGGDMVIGESGDGTSETQITISNGGVLSCGTYDTARWLKLSAGGTTKTTIDVEEGGTLAVWHLRHDSAGASAVNLNGGTLKVLGRIQNGDTHYGLIDTQYPDTFSVSVGADGGILDTNGKSFDIAKEISGSGTLRIIGGGSVTFTVAPTCPVVIDADTTVSGTTEAITTRAASISITAPSSDWASKTLPTTAGIKTITSGNWATYADGGTSYQQTLGGDTAYVALVNVEDGAGDVSIAGLENDTTSAKSYSDIDPIVIVNGGNADFVVGGVKASSNSDGKTGYRVNYTGDTLAQIQGASTTAEFVYGSSYNLAINSTVSGNSGIVIKEGAKVTGSIIGGASVSSFYNSGTSAPSFTGNSVVLIDSLQNDNSGPQLGGDCPANWHRNYNKYSVIGGSAVLGMHNYSYVNTVGNSSVIINLPNDTAGTFSKTIIGGNATLINNKDQSSSRQTGNTCVSITAPNAVTFNQPIYGGGFGIRGNSDITGDSAVTINGGTYTSTICAGNGSGSVSGKATLTITAGVFTGTIEGYNTDSNSASTTGDGATLSIKGNVDLSNCTIKNFDYIKIDKGVTVTISSTQTSMFLAQGLSVEENAGVYTAKYVPKFFWTGASTENKNWSNSDNWIVGDTYETGVATETSPTSSDPVTFESAAEVVIDSANCAAQQITVNAAVTFTGNPLSVGGVAGSGTITLGDGAGFSVAVNVEISNNIAVIADDSTPAVMIAPSGVGITLKGTLLESSGYLKFTGTGSRHYLSVVNNFRGTIEVDVGTTAGDFMAASSGSANVRWVITSYTAKSSKTEASNLVTQGTTGSEVSCNFGKLSGSIGDANASSHGPVIFTVGALCGLEDIMSLTYVGKDNTGRDSVFKMVGAGTFAIDATNVRRYECDSGTIELMTSASLARSGCQVRFNGGALKLNSAIKASTDPSAQFVFKDGTIAVLDDGGIERTFATSIGNDTSASFVKKGAGALTLSAAPAYTGKTRVEEGVLYITTEGGYEPTLDATAEVTSDVVGYRKFIPSTLSIDAPVVGAYGNDFATVSVTAGVTSTYPAATEITYTLKANGTAIATTTAAGDATSVTFGNANVSGLTRYGNISYTVEASGDNVTAATSDATTAMLADSEKWVDEKKSTTGTTGTWKTTGGEAATVTYDNETERAEISDNKFSANNCSTGDVVTVTIKDIIYTALSDISEVDADAQGAVALSTNVVNDVVSTNFFVLTRSNDVVSWTAADGVAGNTNVAYDIELTFDYVNGKYSVSINGTALTIGGVAAFDLVKTANQYVKDIDFLGAGSIKAIEGVQYDAMMAVDQNGVRYATVQEAVSANAGKKGATVTLLHDTANTSFTGWKYDAELKTFIWSVCGVLLLVF